MSYGFLDIAATSSVKAAQEANGVAGVWANFKGHRRFDRFTEAETAFIASRDSLYMASVSETGWPYIQHRGGPIGFLKVLDDRTIGFADFRGNLQYISLGNINADDRVAVIMVDYPRQSRLKLYAHAEVRELEDDEKLRTKLVSPGYKAKVERGILLHLENFDWNCPQHITPRFSEEELEPMLKSVKDRMEALEAENATLRARLAEKTPSAGSL